MATAIVSPMLLPASFSASARGSRATSLLSLLKEDDQSLQEHALRKLLTLVDAHWAEAADLVTVIEALAENEAFPARELASAVASKCYYHLEEYGEALRLALGAGPHFEVNARTEYVETIISRCIDEYTKARQDALAAAPGEEPAPADARLEAVVARMFARCWAEGAYRSALGVALEARRLDLVQETLRRALVAGARVALPAVRTHTAGSGLAAPPADTSIDYLTYAYDLASSSSIVPSRALRASLLRVLVAMHGPDAAGRDDTALCRCLQSLNDAPAVAGVLMGLLKRGCGVSGGGGAAQDPATWSNNVATLTAMQVALDIVDSENQEFAVALYKALPQEVDTNAAGAGSEAAVAAESALESALKRVKSILDGSVPCALTLDFLSSANACDHLLLSALKKVCDVKNSVLHGAIVTAHGLMNAGTTHSGWLNSQPEWLRKAANWSRFSAVASAGVVHRGNTANAMRVLQAYLPRGAGAPTESPFAEGGALYALGIIHAGRGASAAAGIVAQPGAVVGEGAGEDAGVVSYLKAALDSTSDETVQHGACLGLGLAALGTGNDELYASARRVLLEDLAVAGEGAGIAIGLLLLGAGPTWRSASSGEVAAAEMLGHAHATQHEKIVRGIGMGLALMCYGLEDGADGLIAQMVEDKDAVLRYGGMYALGLAYCGTANNSALKRLLHVAVSDVSDDVRRAAVINIGFVLARQPGEVPTVIGHLAESYNPHVRYGAALALGIACAGSGLPDALALLEPLSTDGTDYVRQGASIALGLVLQAEGEAHLPRVKVIRDRMLASAGARGESTMAKMGAILGLGLLDAGGRNCTSSIISRGGFQKASSVVGLALFTQYWYWSPMVHFVSLAITPAALIGITGDLGLPAGPGAFAPSCACRPSWFAYPAPMTEVKEDKKEKMATLELSTAAKARARAKAKATASGEMDVDSAGKAGGAEEEGKKDKAKTEEVVKEADSYTLANPVRIAPAQAKFVRLPTRASGQRFVQLSASTRTTGGVIMLLDTRGSEALPAAEGGDATVRAIRAPTTGQAEEKEAPQPKPFEWEIGQYADEPAAAAGEPAGK